MNKEREKMLFFKFGVCVCAVHLSVFLILFVVVHHMHSWSEISFFNTNSVSCMQSELVYFYPDEKWTDTLMFETEAKKNTKREWKQKQKQNRKR